MCLISAKSTSSGRDDALVQDLPAVDRLGVLATRLVADLAEGHPGDLCILPVFLSVFSVPLFLSGQCVISAELRVSRRLVQLCLSRPRPAPPLPQPRTPGQAGAEAGLGCVICFAL